MRKTVMVLLICMFLMAVGCSHKEVNKHNYVYKGTNESWQVEYRVKGTETFTDNNGVLEYESEAEKLFTATMKDDPDSLAKVKSLEISYQSSVSGGKITRFSEEGLWDEKNFCLRSASKGGALENEDETIEVTINLDGDIEKITLKNVDLY